MLFAAISFAEYRSAGLGELPFAMRPVPEFVFPQSDFCVTDYGAASNGGKCTAAFAMAIADCAKAGGGRVVVPAGKWHVGPIHLKSNVELHLEEEAVLDFSDELSDYLPAVMSSWEGLECMNYSPLVYAYCCTNVAVTGKGSLVPRMNKWKRHFSETTTNIQEARGMLYKWGAEDYPVERRDMTKVSDAVMRPQLMQMNRSVNVRIEGITVRDSPFWTIHLYQCENVVVRGVTARCFGFNNDGIDIEMTRNVLVEDCDICAGDDGFVMKAGRNRDAWRIARPTENVVVRNCKLPSATALLAVGSELSAGVRNIYVCGCEVGDVARLYYVKTNHRRGGFVDNIVIRDVKVRSAVKLMAVETDVIYQWSVFPDYERSLTKISNLLLENIACEGARSGVEIRGDAALPVDGVTFKNVRIETLMNGLSSVEGAINVKMEGLSAYSCGSVTNYWDSVMPFMPEPTVRGSEKPVTESQWKGKKVAFIGDGVTAPQGADGCRKYWDYLARELGLEAYVYATDGCRTLDALDQAKRLLLDLHWYVDAIFVMIGANDCKANVPQEEYHDNLCKLLGYLKENFPDQQTVLMTNPHCVIGSSGSVDGYNDVVRSVGRIWSVPVIDLYAESGLLPTVQSHQRFFLDADGDMFYPNSRGHERIARVILGRMLAFPPEFKRHDGLFF